MTGCECVGVPLPTRAAHTRRRIVLYDEQTMTKKHDLINLIYLFLFLFLLSLIIIIHAVSILPVFA